LEFIGIDNILIVKIAFQAKTIYIRFRMEQQGLTQNDLIPYMGSKSKVSEVLSGKRSLSKEMIRKLHRGLSIPLESLMGEKEPL